MQTVKILILAASLSLFACARQVPEAPPNIILILTDDQGYADISAHGSPDVHTPNMDHLKTLGISLEDFQVSPTCAPTRSALMSGRHPFKCGITHTILERERMAPGITTLPELLRKAGYSSAIFGKWHLGDEDGYQPGDRGFDEVFIHGAGGIGQAYPGSCADVPANSYFDPVIRHNGKFVRTSGFCTDVFFARALEWIQRKGAAGEPFFAYISTNAPHGPFIAPEAFMEKFEKQGYPEKACGFYGMIENIDHNLGILMERIEDWDLSGNTVLIFMSDNGKTWNGGANQVHGETYNAGMKGFKASVHEGGTRVPFFIRWPGHFEPGSQVDVLLNHYDLLPTLAELAGLEKSLPADIDGKSFLSHLEGRSSAADERYRFFHKGRWPLDPANIPQGMEVPQQWVGTAESSDPERYRYQDCAVRNERYRMVNHSELYDLYRDPGQTTDIASEQPELVARFREAYDQWWEAVRPYMVNEEAELAGEKPYWAAWEAQQRSAE